jgi:hypothetical protein
MFGIAAMALLAACGKQESAAPKSTQPASQTAASASQTAQKNALPSLPFPGFNTAEPKRPSWAQLTPAQRQILAPLAGEWDKMEPVRQKKWLEIAARYARMSPAEQQRMQTRMREWTQLTPEQRRIARESYARAKKLDADQKSAKWDHYQSLPAEEKQKLAARAEKKKNVVNLPRAQSGRNTIQAAKPAAPVLPSAPTDTTSAPAPTTPPVTSPAPPSTVPVGGANDSPGGPMSFSPK